MEPAPQPSNGLSGEKKSWMGRKPRVRSCLCRFHEYFVLQKLYLLKPFLKNFALGPLCKELCQRSLPAWPFIASAVTAIDSLHCIDIHSFIHSFIDKHLFAEQTWKPHSSFWLLAVTTLLVVLCYLYCNTIITVYKKMHVTPPGPPLLL